jgi:hypothetical protein
MLEIDELMETSLAPLVRKCLKHRAPDPAFHAIQGHNEELSRARTELESRIDKLRQRRQQREQQTETGWVHDRTASPAGRVHWVLPGRARVHASIQASPGQSLMRNGAATSPGGISLT